MKENWCSEESWFSIMILPLITYMYESVTFISINISNTVKNSFLMCYKNKDYKIVEEHNVNIPKPEANKVYIQYDGINHYTYWTPKIPLILTTTSRIEMEKTIRVTMDMVKTDNTSEKDITELISDKQKQLIDKEDTLNVVRYIQNEIADHYLEHYNVAGNPFSSNKIKYLTKCWKQHHYLNVVKQVGIFGIHSNGFIDFNK